MNKNWSSVAAMLFAFVSVIKSDTDRTTPERVPTTTFKDRTTPERVPTTTFKVVERTHIDCLATGVPGRPSEIRCTKTGADFSFPVYVRPDGAKVGGCRYVRRDHTYRCSTDRRYSNYTPQIHTPRLSTLNIAYFDPKVDAGKWICVEFFGIVSSCNKTTVETCKLECENDGILDNVTCTCSCMHPWSGIKCEKCELDCKNGVLQKYDDCKCLCKPNWSGELCDECIRQCERGHVDHVKCRCMCPKHWYGASCEICDLHCEGSRAKENLKNCSCYCEEPWEGDKCDECDMKCEEGKLNTQTCKCDKCQGYWRGPNCENCILHCEHGQLLKDNCSCNCYDGWSGFRCVRGGPQHMAGGGIDVALIAGIAVAVLLLVAGPVAWVVYRRRHSTKTETDKIVSCDDDYDMKTAIS